MCSQQRSSPRILLASCISLGMIVTRLPWIQHKFASSNSRTRYASAASWIQRTAVLWNLISDLYAWATSLNRRWKGNFRISRSVDFWYFRISRRATVPGRYLCGFLIPPRLAPCALPCLVSRILRGAFPPVDFLAVCFVRAIDPNYESALGDWKPIQPDGWIAQNSGTICHYWRHRWTSD